MTGHHTELPCRMDHPAPRVNHRWRTCKRIICHQSCIKLRGLLHSVTLVFNRGSTFRWVTSSFIFPRCALLFLLCSSLAIIMVSGIILAFPLGSSSRFSGIWLSVRVNYALRFIVTTDSAIADIPGATSVTLTFAGVVRTPALPIALTDGLNLEPKLCGTRERLHSNWIQLAIGSNWQLDPIGNWRIENPQDLRLKNIHLQLKILPRPVYNSNPNRSTELQQQ